MNNITLKAIGEIDFLNNHFLIPYYQRGYRWTDKEVTDLLNDINEFQNKRNKEEGEFYCLQPIVVIEKNGHWEVIDGQQRLTTIFILLTYLKDAREINFSSSDLYTIEYETREKEGISSKEFLNNLNSIAEIDKTNSDFYHMSWAYLTIKKWFEDNKINKGKFLSVLLDTQKINDIDLENNIRFIWYEVTEEINNPIEIFTRLNMGKIPLTNAELVKALFFVTDKNDGDKKRHQLQMGFGWDQIENALQNKNLWYFLTSSDYKGSNHIELIFDIIAKKYADLTSIDNKHSNDKLYTFYVFNELIQSKLLPENQSNTSEITKEFLWDEIKTYYSQFIDFYNDITYYHLIGYLINSKQIKDKKTTIADIVNLAKSTTKKDFEFALREKIASSFQNDLEELSYDETYDEMHNALLLFNVLITMNSRYNKFPFEKFKEENWSLEHIHAQNSEDLKKDSQRRIVLEEQKKYFENKNEDFYTRIEQLLEMDKVNESQFANLQKLLYEEFTNGEEVIHSIQNMALLSTKDNSSLNNSIFPIKKDKIKELDEKGSFIPIGTKNVFLKYYSKDVEQNVSWNIEDQNAYFDELKKILKDYLPKTANNEN